ncbi:MAG: hypothetical protein BroJett011_41690 [Chloroflexota bacterium]|nr:MAG: hypothetical protein BroJett011_41690 [Chloroflexota bacterium]
MFEQNWYESLVKNLKEAGFESEKDEPKLLFQVELGFRLLEFIGLSNEPVDVVWMILTTTSVPHQPLDDLDDQQKRALANARVLLRFGRFAWRDAVHGYAKLAAQWRAYWVDPGQPLKKPAQREPNGPAYVTNRLEIYDKWLTERLAYKTQYLKSAPAGRVTFRTTRQRPRTIVADLDAALVSAADRYAMPRLGGVERPRQPIIIEMDELRQTARALDQRMVDRNLVKNGVSTLWTTLLEEVICLRVVQADGSLSAPNAAALQINGILHLAGMVGAGKSLLMKLLAAHGVLFGSRRTALVIGDALTVLNQANEFNRLLAEGDIPAAAPFVGRTTRHHHLQRLFQSNSLGEAPVSQLDHWGLRWLDTRCALQGVAVEADLKDGPLQPGDEPCERLQSGPPDNPGPLLGCPLFAICPSRQLYRDLLQAQIWITTPGAMANSRLPIALDKRQMLLGELIYHECDLIIFDEVDTIQQWFDNVYATDQWLLDGGQGLLDVMDMKTVEGLNHGYQISRQGQRWITAERNARQVAEQICSLLREQLALKEWIGDRYFTAHRLFFDLARRLTAPSTDGSASNINREVLNYFDRFRQDSILNPSTTYEANPLSQLHAIADQVLARGGSLVDRERVIELCKRWLQTYVKELEAIETHLAAELAAWLKKQRNGATHRTRKRSDLRPDDLDSLAARLELAVSVAILEEMVQITFDSWQHAPLFITSQIADDYRLTRIPRDLAGVLPTPPTGSLFGFQYLEEAAAAPDSPEIEQLPLRIRRFSTFQYRHVGRWYIQHYHDLLNDLGYPGPNVLAMSGTSWLPDSATWHIPVTPQAILEPTEKSRDAIKNSEFYFKPLRDQQGEPIFVSGSGRLQGQLALLGKQIAGYPSPQQSFLQQELNGLELLAVQQPELWRDRVRLLLFVNSYDQVTTVMRAILSQQRDWNKITYGLVRGTGPDRSEVWQWTQLDGQSFIKNDVEQFRQTPGRILIAPLQAIGRGYNILNQDNVAAFGSVLFLTRPMPQPYDMQARAQWLNWQILKRCKNRDDDLWQGATNYYWKMEALREWAHNQWDDYDAVHQFRYLSPERKDDLAASMAGLIIQACGRLLRGGVPFRAFFIDAAWAPETAKGSGLDTAETSLLLRMRALLNRYSQEPVGGALYASLAQSLDQIRGLPLTEVNAA